MEFRQLPSPPPTRPATKKEVLEFLRGLQKFRRKDDKPLDEQAIKEYLNQRSLGSLQGIARRIMIDILKSPTVDAPRAAPAKGERKKKQAAPKPAEAKKRKTVNKKGGKKKAASRKPSKKASRRN